MNWDESRGSFDGRPTLWIKRLLHIPFWPGKSIRIDLHKFVRADDEECFHTHPAWAFRLVLKGGYMEESLRFAKEGRVLTFTRWEPWSFGLIAPEFCHRAHALLDRGRPSYSLWIRGPIVADVKLIGKGWGDKESAHPERN